MEFRPLRPLYYAIGYGGAPTTLLSTPKSDLVDHVKAATRLQRWWPKQWHMRDLTWPLQEDTPKWPDFADVGVFDPSPRGLPVFRRLVNILDDMPSFIFWAPDMKNEKKSYERLGPWTFR